MNIQLLNKNISDIKTDILVEFLTSDNLTEHPESKVLNQAGFKAEQDSICFLHEKGILFCGVEKKKNDEIRSAAASVIKALKSSNYESARISVLSNSTLTGLIEGIVLGGYEFNDYKSEPKEITIKDISLASNELDFDELQTTFNKALIVANATCFTRDIVNTAPQELNPQTMATLAEKLATDNSLECNILHEEELEKEKYSRKKILEEEKRKEEERKKYPKEIIEKEKIVTEEKLVLILERKEPLEVKRKGFLGQIEQLERVLETISAKEKKTEDKKEVKVIEERISPPAGEIGLSAGPSVDSDGDLLIDDYEIKRSAALTNVRADDVTVIDVYDVAFKSDTVYRLQDRTMMRQDRFTEQAQEVLAASQELVRKELHAQWDVEHVLVSLRTHPAGLPQQTLQHPKVDTRQIRRHVRTI